MRIEFDPTKDRTNTAKHGVSLALASQLEWDGALVWADSRKSYGETRQSALGLIGERVYFVAFVDRGTVRRVISLRKANDREVMHYAANT
ncbi:MAG: BrnT family toxin [Rhodoferax sp.]|uniref:BrnT family toxin n=1 Tax=Rhodoferax sp. TaxID=50421 RepID=UPI00261CB34A|nr:BrnT family toxin [Rhodoferax sp.]MDD5336570.1 BrnT family toxin [Rhodoferax sp.]